MRVGVSFGIRERGGGTIRDFLRTFGRVYELIRSGCEGVRVGKGGRRKGKRGGRRRGFVLFLYCFLKKTLHCASLPILPMLIYVRVYDFIPHFSLSGARMGWRNLKSFSSSVFCFKKLSTLPRVNCNSSTHIPASTICFFSLGVKKVRARGLCFFLVGEDGVETGGKPRNYLPSFPSLPFPFSFPDKNPSIPVPSSYHPRSKIQHPYQTTPPPPKHTPSEKKRPRTTPAFLIIGYSGFDEWLCEEM